MTMLNQGILLYIQSFIYFISLLFFIYCDDDCWISFGAKEHFDVMDEIDDRHAEVREKFQQEVGGNNFDKDMLVVMLKNRGIAERALHKAEGDRSTIPAGINLGGHCMMRLPRSLLFFHRMKLRNNTRFRIVDLESNLTTLELKAYLLLNDLHLFGSYDISHTMQDHTLLLYYPSFGEVQFLLKNVSYKIEGRYRLLRKRLNIELVTSEILMDDVLMMYHNQTTRSLETKNIESFIDRLKVDLDKWIKDYFNDYLMYFVIAEDSEFEKYNQVKTTALNEYADKVIDIIKHRIHDIQATAVQLPKFSIQTENGAEIQLRNGALRGLDSIYRRSITTGTKQNNIRKVDTVVGFSNLKLLYRYDTIPQSGLPAVTGVLTLIADELTAHLGLSLIKDPETVDLSFKFLEQTKPESLTVEGSANRMISNFKYVLERHVIGIMMNSLMHNINMLGTLDRCVPIFTAYRDETNTETDDYSLEIKNKSNVNENINVHLKQPENGETEANHGQESHQQSKEGLIGNSDHPKAVETKGSQEQENQHQSQESPNGNLNHPGVEETEANHGKESHQQSQEGLSGNTEHPEVVETKEIQEQEKQHKSKEDDNVKETADNSINSRERENNINTLKGSTNHVLIGYEVKKEIEQTKKLKYRKRNPKFKKQKELKKAGKGVIKY